MEAHAFDLSKMGPGSPKQHLTRSGSDFLFTFNAMATPCEVRIETDSAALAQLAADIVESEARRVESKYSRYKADSVVGLINASSGRETLVDVETTHLLNFAAQCFDVSGGLFDITSGILRRAWKFDGSDRVPTSAQIDSLQDLI